MNGLELETALGPPAAQGPTAAQGAPGITAGQREVQPTALELRQLAEQQAALDAIIAQQNAFINP